MSTRVLPNEETPKGFLQEMSAGWATTRMLVAWRWRMVRSQSTRFALVGGGLFFLFGWLMAMNFGYVIRLAALTGETTSGIFAQTWMKMIQYDQTTTIASYALGGALAVGFLAPLTGTSTLSLIPTEDLYGLRPPSAHRYFDSLIINLVSGIGLLQLLALTGVASMMTLDGDRFPALLLSWSIWVFAVVLTTTMGWILEWVARRWRKTSRRITAAILFGALGVVVVFDPDHGRTMFGLGTHYTTMMRDGSVTGITWPLVAAIILLAITSTTVLFTGVIATRFALRLPLPPQAAPRTHRPSPLGVTPTRIATNLLIRVVWRTPECRRPLLTVVGFGVPAVLFAPLEGGVETTVILAVPLAIALAWGVNFFGVMGTGMAWVASQPQLLAILPRVAMGIQVATTFGLLTLLWLIGVAAGQTDPASGPRILLEAILATILVAAVSVRFSIRRPVRARLSGRGDSLLPPLTALSYMVRLVSLSFVPGILVALELPGLLFAGLSLIVFAIGLTIYLLEDKRWDNPRVRAHVVTAVSAD